MELANPTNLLDPALPARPHSLPPEIISLVLSSLTDLLSDDSEGWRIRDGTLAAAALVSKDWSDAAYRELYADLRLEWVGRRRKAILEAFTANPMLHSRVRKLSAELTTLDTWLDRWYALDAFTELSDVADGKWPPDEAGWLDDDGPTTCEQESAEEFWDWVGQHSSLDFLDVGSLQHPLPLEDDHTPPLSLQGVLARLKHVKLQGSHLGCRSILSYLTNAKTLTVGRVGNADPRALPSPSWCRPLRLLKKLQLHQSPELFDNIFALSPLTNLVVLSLRFEYITRLPPSLPSLPSLRSLHITGSPYNPHVDVAQLISSFAPPSLSHLQLYFWPTQAILSSLPTTIEFLDVNIPPHALVGNPSSLVSEVRRMRAKQFPALRAVRIRDEYSFVAFSPLLQRLQERLAASPEAVEEDFEVVVEEGAWRRLLPREWWSE